VFWEGKIIEKDSIKYIKNEVGDFEIDDNDKLIISILNK